ncbi:hypothetical protein MSG28_003217 [Choristoneura fumiferana]|uniref:Uncharacterized protein n=1 Tax=Choristoneura fumiferana TaxID=7141 RepID=A0ACC0KF43_CHOFU|nr:hypothetical protein MSG28_003217 [Choristoneura fumiferana]
MKELLAVTDPRDGRRVALKKLPNVFQSLVSSKRVFRELKMLCFFKHENVLSALDILQPPTLDFFQEMYPFQSRIVLERALAFAGLVFCGQRVRRVEAM